MNFFQKAQTRSTTPEERMKTGLANVPQTAYPNLCRQIDSSQLVKRPSKLQLYAAIKTQNLTDDISEYFGEFQPTVLDNDEADSLLLTKLLGWSEDVIANPDKDIEIIVGQKFIKTNSEPSNSLPNNQLQKATDNHLAQKSEVSAPHMDPSFTPHASHFDEFLKKTYENYCKNFQGEKSKMQDQVSKQIEESQSTLPKGNLEKRRSHLQSRLSESLNKQIPRPKHKAYLEPEDSVDEFIEEMTYHPARFHGHSQTTFCGFHVLQTSKSDKLTATTMSSVGGFFNAEENCFD
jgi:hypothetical protein